MDGGPLSFDLGTVLSVTTPRLLTRPAGPRDNGIGDLYRLLDHMQGYSHFTHMLPDGAKACGPVLLERFPELAKADLTELDALLAEHPGNAETACSKFLDRCIAHGMKPVYDIEPIGGEVEPVDPIESLVELVSAEKVVVIEMPSAEARALKQEAGEQ